MVSRGSSSVGESFLRFCRFLSTTFASWWLRVRFWLDPDDAQFELVECVICADARWRLYFVTLHCEHAFCGRCLGRYVASRIDDGLAVDVKCPMSHACGENIAQHELQSICEDSEELWEQLLRVQLRQALRAMPDLYHCPSPDCGNAVFLSEEKRAERKSTGFFSYLFGPKYVVDSSGADARKFVCQACLYQHCLVCQKTWSSGAISHDDIACDEYQRRLEGTSQHAENREWLATHTRPCPRCKVHIDKNGGCQHMKCRSCQFDFCWNCLSRFDNYGHRCDPGKRAQVSRKYSERSRRRRRRSGGLSLWGAIGRLFR